MWFNVVVTYNWNRSINLNTLRASTSEFERIRLDLLAIGYTPEINNPHIIHIDEVDVGNLKELSSRLFTDLGSRGAQLKGINMIFNKFTSVNRVFVQTVCYIYMFT